MVEDMESYHWQPNSAPSDARHDIGGPRVPASGDQVCSACGGTGIVKAETCAVCGGSGHLPQPPAAV